MFYILIAVALIAALSYAVSNGMRGGGDNLSSERGKLLATELVEYTNILGNAASQLKLRGCADTEISFENPISATDYTNAGAPSDNSCHIFSVAGAGVQFQDAPEGASNAAESITFTASMEVDTVGMTCAGASCADLLVLYQDLSSAACIAINDLLGVENPSDVPPTDSELSFTAFQGSYSYAQTLADEAAEVTGRKAACVEDDNTGEFVYYKVLIAR